jgi:hypothetical protein
MDENGNRCHECNFAYHPEIGKLANTRMKLAVGDQTENQYEYGGLSHLSPERLFFWILVDKTEDQFGLHDVEAVVAILAGRPVLPTGPKFRGATPGTSLASLAARNALNVKLPFLLPTLTGNSVRTLRIRLRIISALSSDARFRSSATSYWLQTWLKKC